MVDWSKYDKIPFVFTGGLLPALVIFIIFRHHPFLPQLDDMVLMRIAFGTTIGAVVFTWIWKIVEDYKTRELRKLEARLRKMDIQKKSIKSFQNKIEEEISEITSTSSEDKTEKVEKKLAFLGDRKNELNVGLENLNKAMEELQRKIVEERANVQSKSIGKAQADLKKWWDRKKRDLLERTKIASESTKNLVNEEVSQSDLLRKLNEASRDATEDMVKRLQEEIKRLTENSFQQNAKALERLGIYAEIEEVDEEDDEKKKYRGRAKENKRANLLVFAGLYAIIGGLAITSAIEVFIDSEYNPNITYAHEFEGFVELATSKPALLVASFFPIAIIFIHCGVIFLSTDATDILSQGKRSTVFISSLLIFLQGVILFYAGSSVDNILNFTLWILLLAITDIVFMLINLYKGLEDGPQWIHLDMIMAAFLLSVLMLFSSPAQTSLEVYVYVMVTMLFVTIVDYIISWKSFWAVYDASEWGV